MIACPKCTSRATWAERIGLDVVLRCRCGLHKIVYTAPDGTRIAEASAARLPQRGTKLWYCLAMLVGMRYAFLSEIVERLNMSERTRRLEMRSAEVSGYLTVLGYKELAFRLERRQRLSGGSLWTVTDDAITLFEESGHHVGTDSQRRGFNLCRR